jgi:hypothetical protein
MRHSLLLPTAALRVAYCDPIRRSAQRAVHHPARSASPRGDRPVRNTDNDQFLSLNRADAGHFAIHGTVTSESSQRYRVRATFHSLVLRSGELVHLTPPDLHFTRIGG